VYIEVIICNFARKDLVFRQIFVCVSAVQVHSALMMMIVHVSYLK